PQALLWGDLLYRGWRRGVRLHLSRNALFFWGPSLLQCLSRQFTGKRAYGLDQQVAADDIACRGIAQIIQTTLGRALVAHRLQKTQRGRDAAACGGVQHDKALIQRRDLSWQSVPLQDALVEAMDGLRKRYLDLQSRGGNRGPRRFPKLRHDHLLCLIDLI